MNWSKNLYAFMLGILIVFSGCFGTGTSNGDDGDADDASTSGTTIINNYYNNTSPSNGLNWYTSGGTHTTWNDDNSAADGANNYMQGTWLDNQTWNQTSTLNDWNVTECVSQGGEVRITRDTYGRDKIYCDLTFTTINTSSGEVLMIYQWDNMKLTTTCDGVSDEIGSDPNYASGTEYYIVTGSALNCEHRIWTTLQYHVEDWSKISSIVYTIQDATVV